MRILRFLSRNMLFIITLFLLAFIPLYPKIPLVDVQNTWVYIRAEDVVVLLTLLVWFVLFLKQKATLKTPLTIPIFLFWIVGAVSTLHGVLLIFPTISDVFPNVALLSFLRRVEYLSLFFVAYASMRDKKMLSYVIGTLVITLIAVSLYGLGQKYLGFPAYLTMNEEFAKGVPIQLSSLSRVPSTFAGHYDLAAYLVLVVPIVVSLLFGIKNWLIRLILLGTVGLGTVIMFLTVSRVSFVVLFASLFVVLLFQKKRLALISIPILAVIGVIFLTTSTTLLQRFGNTISDVNVLVNANTGNAIGNIEMVTPEYLEGKVVKTSVTDRVEGATIRLDKSEIADPASRSARLIFDALPQNIPLVRASNISTGEELTAGTGYINLHLSPVTGKVYEFFYEKPLENNATASAEIYIVYGNFILKNASAYDLSFTTRFQGGWPIALEAFSRNVFLGSGFGSASLAIDNNYFRLLGEVGLLGLASFIGIFIVMGIYIKKSLPHVDSPVAKSFVYGFSAGVIGLFLNATLIDVFEASKVAFTLWLLSGITLGVLSLYNRSESKISQSLKTVLTSSYAVAVYIGILVILMYSPMLSNYFVGDDYTWFRWAIECGVQQTENCPSIPARIAEYFTESEGFFFRPGTKSYFLTMYSAVWLNPQIYHGISLLLHFTVAFMFFVISKRILKSTKYAFLAVFLLLIMSGYAEIVFWISATGHLFNAVFMLFSLLSFMLWREKRNIVYLILSFISVFLSMMFHELGIVTPLLLVLYYFYDKGSLSLRNLYKQYDLLILSLTIPLYLLLRYTSHSHWFSGDYNYNLLKLPFNAVGNALGYGLISLFGPSVLPVYTSLRENLRENVILAVVLGGILLIAAFFAYKKLWPKFSKSEKKIIGFGLAFFVISLIPFLGLGNITSRYSYVGTLGIILVLIVFIQRMYDFLLLSGRQISLVVSATVILIFSLFHVIQLQQMHGDWHEAGVKVQKFFVSLNHLYVGYWSERPMEFHFVNVPIKTGDAWVFPVGLSDAIWLVLRNPDISVYSYSNEDEAIQQAGKSPYKRALIFDSDGSLEVPVIEEEEDE